jgi:5,10-methylene-tetrahydrofolate dehydrogenase/methenyl tetrahydrofolate cyclohydrolase
VHGILVQLPLPKGVNEHRVIEAIDPAKDVDGLPPCERRPVAHRASRRSSRARRPE